MKSPFQNAKVVASDVAPQGYHADAPAKRGQPGFVMSRSALMNFADCPSRWVKGYDREDSKSTEWGTLMDCLVLQPHQFKTRFAITPATYPATPKRKDDPPEQKPWTRNATYCREWEENQIGKVIVKPEQLNQAKGAALAFAEDAELNAFRDCSVRSQLVTANYQDAETGISVPVKILIDLVPAVDSPYGKSLGDFKTTFSAAPRAWSKSVFNFNYDCQAAFYLDLYTAATGEDRTDFFQLVQESFAPWQTARRILTSEFLEIGRMKYLNALGRYAECLKTGNWPDYDSKAARHWKGWAFCEPEQWMMNAAA